MPASKQSIRVALLQLNPIVGDLAGNLAQIQRSLRWAEGRCADLAITPELALTGYPPEDLLLRPEFLTQSALALRLLASKTRSTPLICGYPAAGNTGAIHNSAAVLRSGKLQAVYHKIALPNYGVFDERRYFTPGNRIEWLGIQKGGRTLRIALSICEDLWPTPGDPYFRALGNLQPDLVISLSASPYDRDKHQARLRVLSAAARRAGAPVVYVNLVGGQDELVFDGRSLIIDPQGKVLARAAALAEDLLCVDVPLGKKSFVKKSPTPVFASLKPSEKAEEILSVLEFSLKDYVRKNGFTTVGVAMSGGIDSAVVAGIAVRALGKDNVVGVTLPSEITSGATLKDARKQAKTIGIRFLEISIRELQSQFLRALEPVFQGAPLGAADENLQARVRGTLMMALSNHMGFLLLATGNKSELATGYCTLYGDMAGGFAPIKDLTKTWVYRVALAINRLDGRQTIPASVIHRAPTAELKPGQKDQDILPPYPKLDAILERLVETDASARVIRQQGGFAARHVNDTARRLVHNEYKRRQAPPGTKVTAKSFGRDRRMPISQRNGHLY